MVVLPASGCEMMAKVRRLATSLSRGGLMAGAGGPVYGQAGGRERYCGAMGRKDSAAHRCPACRMHLTLCICALIEPLATRTRVVVLLHQLEQEKPTNTGRLAARCLSNSRVIEPGGAREIDPDSDAESDMAWTTPG